MSEIKNSAGETVFTGSSDAECVRWWNESGRGGDYLQETGELMSEVAGQLALDERPRRLLSPERHAQKMAEEYREARVLGSIRKGMT